MTCCWRSVTVATSRCHSENFQRLQQHLAQMILECLERRSVGSIKKRGTLSPRLRKGDPGEGDYQPEYLHLATVDNTLSTFL